MIFDNSVIRPVFIGREDDLRWLDRLISKSKGGNGQIALISGEAEIGKSGLVKEATAHVPERTIIMEGHCFRTESALPYAPLLDLYRNFFATRRVFPT